MISINFTLALLSALSRLITTLKESDNLSNDQEIDFLKALLESKELNALVNVHTKVAKVGRDERLAPVLSTSAQVLYEVLEQLSQRCHLSDDCKEAFHLLQESHVQVRRLQSIDNVIEPNLNITYSIYSLHTMPLHRRISIPICPRCLLRWMRMRRPSRLSSS